MPKGYYPSLPHCCFLSLAVMILRINLPSVLKVTVLAISKCNSAIAMFVVGTVLAEAPRGKSLILIRFITA